MRASGKPSAKQRDLFGGRGVVEVWDLLAAQHAPPFSAVIACALEPSGVVGRHVQQRDPEIVVGIAGEGEALVDGSTHALTSGAVVYLAHGQTLSIRNLSETEVLDYLIIKSRAQPASGGGGGAP